MLQVKQSYGVRRVAEIAAKVEAARVAVAPIEATAPVHHRAAYWAEREAVSAAFYNQPTAAVYAAIGECEKGARFDELCALFEMRLDRFTIETAPVLMVAPLPIIAPAAFDFTPDAPAEVEPIETGTTPATLETLDEIALYADLEVMRREARRAQLDALIIERLQLRRDLVSLENADADGRFDGADFSDEIEAVRSRLDELDELLIMEDDVPFIFGFDDLPAAYFEAVLAA